MPLHWPTLLLLVVITAASFAVTELLGWRWTRQRRYFLLREWCRTHGLRLMRPIINAAPPLPELLSAQLPRPMLRWHFSDGRTTVLRVQSGGETHNLLILPIATEWPATALRPSVRASCLLDRLELFNYPSQYGVQRFSLHGQHPQAARQLSDSQIRGLLPADLAFLLVGRQMVVDFSVRAFDPIELDRVIALVNQLSAALPAPPKVV